MNCEGYPSLGRVLPFRDPATPLTPKQIKVRKATARQVIENPLSFDMNDWEIQDESWGDNETMCYTTRCAAGWALYFHRGRVQSDDGLIHSAEVEEEGIRALGLTEKEYYEARGETCNPLFYDNNSDVLPRVAALIDGL
jgi:hypothetical protein